MFSVTCCTYKIDCLPSGLPEIYGEYCKHARLVDQVEPFNTPEGQMCYVGVRSTQDWPFLVIAQKFRPCGPGWYPGVLLIPETNVMLVGAGERLLAYDLLAPKRLWEDKADVGFWGWQRHGDVVLMSAELELAAWDLRGKKLWSSLQSSVFVEPPWGYVVEKDQVRLDIMGKKVSFPITTGPK